MAFLYAEIALVSLPQIVCKCQMVWASLITVICHDRRVKASAELEVIETMDGRPNILNCSSSSYSVVHSCDDFKDGHSVL